MAEAIAGMTRAWGVIRPGTELYETWAGILGSDAIPIRSEAPRMMDIAGAGRVAAYEVDVLAMPPGAISRLVRELARSSGLPPRMIQAEIVAGGFPLALPDVFATGDPAEGRRFWAGEAAGDRPATHRPGGTGCEPTVE